ncbi:lipopolysaccharide biosynthesis protein [Rhodococcus sp. NPDC057529]|uniref:lipopolysaccharide biosynthesis protein n=1 Tax=Rhodococcus sp. NPDC057529 TaxID=3346158 RepID=UPI00366EA1D9
MIRSPAGLVIARLLSAALALVTSPLIARAIGAEGRGLVAAATTALMILPIGLAFGLPWAVRRRCSLDAQSHAVIRSARLLSLLTIVPGVGFAFLLYATLLSDLPEHAGVWFVVGLALTPLVVTRNCQISLLVVEQKYLRILLVTLSQPAAYFVLILGLFISSRLSVTAVISSYVVSVGVSYLMTSRIVLIPWFGNRVSWRPLVGEAWRASGAQISEIASYRLNQLLLLPLIGGAALGNYAVAVNIALAPAPIGHAVGAAGFKGMATGSEADRRKSVDKSLRSAVWLAILSALGVSALSPFVIPWAFGREFRSAIPATIVLAVGGVFVICNYVMTSGLVARNQPGRASIVHFSGFIVGLVALLLLSPPLGLMGAALASVIGFVATSVTASVFLRVGIGLWIPRLSHLRSSFSVLFGR